MIVTLAAEALFHHWQRGAGTSAKLDWDDITPHLRGVFEEQARAALRVLELIE